MAEVKWIKLVTEFFDDEKIKLIESMPEADMVLIIWVKLLTLAGKKNMNGYIFLTENIPYTDEMLATLFNRPTNTIRLALETFKNFGMISCNGDGRIQIINWDKHQNTNGLDKIREDTKKRVAKYREKQKQIIPPTTPLKEEDIKNKIRVEEEEESNVTVTLHKKPTSSKIKFNLLTNKWEGITDEDIVNWEKFNPGCNVKIQLATMREWLMDDPTRIKKVCRKWVIDWIKRTFDDDRPKKKNKPMSEEEIMKIIGGK